MGNKSNKMLSLDNSIMEQLKDVSNVSQLVNGLLIKHFNQINNNNLHPEKEAFVINDDMSVKEKLGVLKKKQKFEKERKENQKRIEEIKINPLIKNWFLELNIKPKYLELVDFMKHHKIPLTDQDVLSIWKEWDNVKANCPAF